MPDFHSCDFLSARPAFRKCVCVGELKETWNLSFVFSPTTPGGLKVTCEYMAQQEGVLCEEVLLLSETNEDVCVKVKVHARVMGEVALRVKVM